MTTQELREIRSRYDSKRKAKSNRRKLLKIKPEKIAKIKNISKNELNKAEKFQKREIARLRRIKNSDKLTKEDLIISLLKSESSPAERNFEKPFKNNTDDNDNYDDKIRGKISDIRIILSRLGNIVTNKDSNCKKITEGLYEIEKKENLSDKEKEENYDHFAELVNAINKKEEYKYHDRDDLDYYGIRDIENLFDNDNADDDNYYKPILVKSSFKVK